VLRTREKYEISASLDEI